MNDNSISRREFGKKMFATAISISFLETLFTGCSNEKNFAIAQTNKIIEPKAAIELNHWAIELNEICSDLKSNKIPQTIWQEQINKLYSRIEVEELLKFIDFEKLSENLKYPDLGVNARNIDFPTLEGLPKNTIFTKKIFGMKKDRAIIPHGHSNMVSAHFILKGEFALRHYDKIKDETEYLIIKPTIERSVKVGDYSSISDVKDNVHWFIAKTDSAFTFDIIMSDLNEKKYEIHNIDIKDAEKIENNLIRAKKLDVETALKKYGKDHHANMIKTL